MKNRIPIARFAKGVKHHVRLHVVATPKEARRIIPGYEDDMEACCEYDHGTASDRKGVIVFLAEKLTAGVIVHECANAALCWTVEEVMTHPLLNNASPEALQAHYEEAHARACEQLFDDAFAAVLVPRLAEAIVEDLFRNGAGEEAERLVMLLQHGRDGGGWCRGAVRDRVTEILNNPTEERL